MESHGLSVSHPDPGNQPDRGFLSATVRGWNRFWFSPADPTPLGVIRILCGIMVLYVHLAYSYDLMNFHGPHAWLDLKIINELRHEAPLTGPTTSREQAVRL